MRTPIISGLAFDENDGRYHYDPRIMGQDEAEQLVELLEAGEEIGRRRRRRNRDDDDDDRNIIQRGVDRVRDARQASLTRRLDRSERREERADERRSDRGSGGEQRVKEDVWREITATNAAATPADVSAQELMQYENFEITRIIDNGSTAGARIYRIWAGEDIIFNFGSSGIALTTIFAPTSQAITNEQFKNKRVPMGVNLRCDFQIPATGTASVLFQGQARIPSRTC